MQGLRTSLAAIGMGLAILASIILFNVRGASTAGAAARPPTQDAGHLAPGNPSQLLTNAAAVPTPGAITVVGDGQATGSPDIAFINLGVQTKGTTAKEALANNSTAMDAVIAHIKAQGVDNKDIQTSGVNLNPVQSQPRPGDTQPPQITGYNANNGVTVTVRDIANVGSVLDAAVAAGANTANGVRFGLKDPAALQQTALQSAVKAARARADAIAAAGGIKVTGILAVSEEQFEQPIPRPFAAAAASAAPSTPIQPGELTVSTRVVVSFSFQ